MSLSTRPLAALGAGLLAMLTACQGSAPHQPDAVPAALSLHDAISGWQPGWRLTIDATADAATLEPGRTSAAAGGMSFLLALDQVMPLASVVLNRVARQGEELHLTYTVRHPFPPPDLTKAPGAKNRADLGFAARCVFGLDVTAAIPGQTSFFDGDVILEPAIIRNADGYIQPGSAIPFGPRTATAFPFQTLIDERGTGNRLNLSNAGKATGNYQPSVGGWQRHNLGTGDQIRWTGYGFLHQGQAAQKTLIIDRAALLARGGAAQLDLHLLAKYTDPRGGTGLAEKLANRIPPTLSKPDQFAYRLPYAALDVEGAGVAAAGPGLLPNDPASNGPLVIRVTDWDARASESMAESFFEESDLTKVPAGTAGPPAVRVHLPSLMPAPVTLTLLDDDSPWGGDAAADTGHPGDELAYHATITNTLGTGTTQEAGYYLGVAEITDPEFGLDRRAWELPLHPDLTPLAEAMPEPRIWQVVRMPVGDFGVAGCPNAPQTADPIAAAPQFLKTIQLNNNPANFYTSYGPLDFAAWRTPAYGGILFQAYHDGVGDVTTPYYDLYSIEPVSETLSRITDLGEAFKDKQISSLDTDQTNRVIFSQLDGATLFSDANITYAYAGVNISYFDYAGSALTAAPKKINTGANRIVALTTDREDAIWAVDHLNRLRRWKRIPSGYQDDAAALRNLPVLLNLATDFWVCAFAVNSYNGALFLLIKLDDGETNEGRVYRLECDGSFRASIAGNPNPLVVGIYEYGGTLKLDNHAPSGALLNGGQDAQLLVGGFADPSDLYVITSDLTITAERFTANGAMEFQPLYTGSHAIARMEVAGYATLDVYTLPAGWQ